MKRNTMRIMSCLIAFLITVSVSTFVPAVSAADIHTDGSYEYEIITAGWARITRYIGDENQVYIPMSIDGHLIREIGSFAFYCCNTIEHIFVSETVELVGQSAFSSCESLKTISVPAATTSISEYAFEGCVSLERIDVDELNECYSSLDGVLLSKDKTQLITCPIGKPDAFYKIPSSVDTVNDLAFYNCGHIEKIEIPDSVKTIGNYAFSGCTALKSIVVPSSVSEIGEGVFYNCAELADAVIMSRIERIGDYMFWGCERLRSIKIPSGVKAIGEGAFDGCEGLTSVFFEGDKDDWDRLDISKNANEKLFSANYIFNSGDDVITVRLPVPPEIKDTTLLKVYRVDADGTMIDMNAVFEDGYMVFRTDKNGSFKIVCAEPSKPVYELGDVNADGQVNIKDATAIQKSSASLIILDDKAMERADYDRNGIVNVKDATAVQKFVAGII